MYHFDSNIGHGGCEDFNVIVKSWILADKLLMIACKNQIMDDIHAYIEDCVDFLDGSTIKALPWDDLRTDQPLWKYFVDRYANDLMDLRNDNIWDPYDYQRLVDAEKELFMSGGNFIAAVVERLLLIQHRVLRSIKGTGPTGCTYHDHTDGSNCEMDNVLDKSWDIKTEESNK